MNSQKAQIHEENKGCRKEAKILAFTYAVTRFFFFFFKDLDKKLGHNAWHSFQGS